MPPDYIRCNVCFKLLSDDCFIVNNNIRKTCSKCRLHILNNRKTYFDTNKLLERLKLCKITSKFIISQYKRQNFRCIFCHKIMKCAGSLRFELLTFNNNIILCCHKCSIMTDDYDDYDVDEYMMMKNNKLYLKLQKIYQKIITRRISQLNKIGIIKKSRN